MLYEVQAIAAASTFRILTSTASSKAILTALNLSDQSMRSDIKLGPGLNNSGGSPFTFNKLHQLLSNAAKLSALSMAAINALARATLLEIRPEGSFISYTTVNNEQSIESIHALANLLTAVEDHSTTNSVESKTALEVAKRKFDDCHLNNIKAALGEICRSDRREIFIEINGRPLTIAVPHKATIQLFNSSSLGEYEQKEDRITRITSRTAIRAEEFARLLLLQNKISTEPLRPGKRLRVIFLKENEAISVLELKTKDDPNGKT